MGVRVSVESASDAPRVAALSWEATEHLLMLDVTPLTVADAGDYRAWVVRPTLPAGVPSSGSRLEPNLELLAELQPELIVIPPLLEDIRPLLERIAPVQVYQGFSQQHDNLQVQREAFLDLARALGREALARQRQQAMDAELAQWRERLRAHYGQRLPAVTVIRLSSPTAAFINGPNSMPQHALALLGLQPALDLPPSPWGITQVPITALGRIEEGVVLHIEPFAQEAQLFASPLWQAMPFVREQRFAAMPSTWTYGGVFSLQYLAEAIGEALLKLPSESGKATQQTLALTTSPRPPCKGSFRLHDKPVLNAGYSRSVFWLRLDLHYSDWIGRLVRLPVRSQLPAHGEHSPWVDRLLLLLMACGAGVMILALSISYATALRLATYLALLFTVVIFAAGILAWLRGMRVARYFIFAWTAFLIGGIVNTLMVLGYLPNVFLTMYASQIGSALEVGLLSLALADRINAMKEERTRILQEAGRKLETLNQELADSNRFKDEFLATVTHELRTPMNGVIGSLELMQTVKMDIELEQYQKTAAASARDMMRMVNDILALTELQAGKLYPRRETFSLRGLFDGLRAQYAARAEDKGLTFALELDDNLPDTLEGDAAKLAQALGY
jgi:iron complex transport system substrate-binding protein